MPLSAFEEFKLANQVAKKFLGRWSDVATIARRDELAHDAAVEAWSCRERVRDPERFPAFVRTISRRMRCRMMERLRLKARWIQPLARDEAVVDEPAEDPLYLIDEYRVEQSWLLQQLDSSLAFLGSLNRLLLCSYYEGFSCSELADRFDLVEESVKVRIHRSRGRLAKELTKRVRRAANPWTWSQKRDECA